jgi:alpha-methylacyl-CoA racemase
MEETGREDMGPLRGSRIIEIAGIGPGPFAGMMLADMGAEVLRVERPGGGPFAKEPSFDLLNRGKRCICVDLKKEEGVGIVLRLVERADALFEGFRPGVVERLGLGPEVCLERNPRLVFGRMTGWGQDGPLARAAGHDINYISLSGALHAMGRRGEKPAIPLNLVGDFGGGGLLLAYGMVCALLEAKSSGRGQVVDASMVEGAAALMMAIYGAHQYGFWSDERGSNMLDSGAPFYEVYETADKRYISLGALEPQFYEELLGRLGLAGEDLPPQLDSGGWETLSERFAALFKTRTRDEWCKLLEGSDACFAPVLAMSEVHEHAHNVARGTFIECAGVRQVRPVPRFSRTDPTRVQRPPARVGEHTEQALRDWGFSQQELAELNERGVIA